MCIIRQLSNYFVVMENQDFSLWRKEIHMDQLSLVNFNSPKFDLEGKFFNSRCILSF